MTRHSDRKKKARAEQAAAGVPYSVARTATTGEPATGTALAEEIPAEELGVAALPANATPEQRARAEATWRAQPDPGQPCRCSGGCNHGEPCELEYDDGGRCTGRWVHVDRQPGSMFSTVEWEDTYVCPECGEQGSAAVTLPAMPWGESGADGHGIRLYDGIRHPMFPETWPGFDPEQRHPEGDGSCRACGGYALSGLLCDGCRADGWTDDYGMIGEPDPDDDPNACPECGAGGGGNPYGECVCYPE